MIIEHFITEQLRFIIVYQLTVNCFFMFVLQDQLPLARQLKGFIASIAISSIVGAMSFVAGSLYACMNNMMEHNVHLWIFDGIVGAFLQLIFWYCWLLPKEHKILVYLIIVALISWVLGVFLLFV
ncbi:MAG: hypothetical protein BWY54_00013 [Candidatus Dependentiae bacterium ADurb.Bin331]|nr:MAG: hypothetical protein BWY54_00013 [Candidatus Dependentiae bacterium ADurb.Bin331]